MQAFANRKTPGLIDSPLPSRSSARSASSRRRGPAGSKIELRLSVLFSFLLRAPPWTAWAAWSALFNSNSRRGMIRALVAELDRDLPERAELLELTERVAKVPPARNAYAHRPWLLVGDRIYQLDSPAMPLDQSLKHHVALVSLERERDFLAEARCRLDRLCDPVRQYLSAAARPELTRQPRPWPGKFQRQKGRRSRQPSSEL